MYATCNTKHFVLSFIEKELHLGIDTSNKFDVSALDLYYL